MTGDVSSVLLTFNEILENGFDGHNFISGLNSHMRDLIVSKDESTIRLLEATTAVKQKYLQQTGKCPVDFLFKALEIGSNCDLTYKSSKNPRLHVELTLIRLCRLMNERGEDSEKKKSDSTELIDNKEELPLPSKSEIIRKESQHVEKMVPRQDVPVGKHEPVIEKPSKAFSIKDVISDEIMPVGKYNGNVELSVIEGFKEPKQEFSLNGFEIAWQEFIEQVKGEGPRIVSMFKSIKPEVENDETLRIHLSNVAQKDTFIQNYKQRLLSFLEKRFIISALEIETTVDLTDSNDILYTDEQKSNFLFTKYPILKDMKKTFNLDIT
jgi:DNA polymerase-3 subunit gamma/tau